MEDILKEIHGRFSNVIHGAILEGIQERIYKGVRLNSGVISMKLLKKSKGNYEFSKVISAGIPDFLEEFF